MTTITIMSGRCRVLRLYEPSWGKVGPQTPSSTQFALFYRLSNRVLVRLDGAAFLESIE